VPVLRLFREIKNLGCTGSPNLLHRYITQGRVEADRPALSPKRLARLLLTAPDQLKDHHRHLLDTLTATCAEMTAPAGLVCSFAALLTPRAGNDERLDAWITAARTAGLPHLHAFTRGLDHDHDAVRAALMSWSAASVCARASAGSRAQAARSSSGTPGGQGR
jgi:hypothetical protein